MNLEYLPWINIKDEDAVYYARPYLSDEPVILEAGTCAAEDTIRFKKVWDEATVYGFEPVMSLYKKSVENTVGYFKVKIYPYALGREKGEVAFYESSTMPGASSMFPDNLNDIVVPDDIKEAFDADGGSYFDIEIIVKCVTVDDWCAENNVFKIDYFWLDAEGSELDILKSAETILPTVSVIQTEVNFQEFRKGTPLFEEVHEYILGKGFDIKYIWQARPNWQGNAIYVRKDMLQCK